jgi:DNA polymerase III subunit epsilon
MLPRAMADLLAELEVLALDGQAGGATPAYGDLLELGWARCSAAGLAGPVRSHWIVPRTDRAVPWPVRELTGWSEASVAEAVAERTAWAALRADLEATNPPAEPTKMPTVIHFARFELPFLHDLCRRIDGSDQLPLDVVCLHAVATRLFPDLPRRNIRALAGYLGGSPGLVRRAAGHVEATAFIWRAMVPLLEERSVSTWTALKAWLGEPAPARARPARPAYPFARDRRRALPDGPGVYRFRRPSGDVLYVGKAASVRTRVTGHFAGRGAAGERGLEMLTQVNEVDVTETATELEAALLETDEIKRLDPPYNVQLRAASRQAWFASPDLRGATPAPDAEHRLGPLPSELALLPLAALTALVDGTDSSPGLWAAALAVPTAFAPPPQLFDEGFRTFIADHLSGADPDPTTGARLARASRALFLLRGRAEPDVDPDARLGPADWDLPRVRRRLERALVQTGLLVRRTRFLCLLVESTVAFRERGMRTARALAITAGVISERHDVDNVTTIADWPVRPPRAHHERQACFDAAVYDRLRVLTTELRRVQDQGGETALRIGAHTFPPGRLARLMLAI